jgi:deoxyribose-phosphate aldolase
MPSEPTSAGLLPGRPLASYIDHTLLSPTATEADIVCLCREALQHNFRAVCVNGCHLETAREVLKGSGVSLAAVVGFPLGAMATEAKLCEAEACLLAGADELDMVLNLGWLKAGNHLAISSELRMVRQAAPDATLKLILETCFLDEAEKTTACRLALEAGWDFVKTSTGFGRGGATLEDVRLMKRLVSDRMQVKASGGIRDLETALAFIAAGANRLGTSSGLALVAAAQKQQP